MGSPGSRVAPAVVPLTEPVSLGSAIAFAKLSLGGWADHALGTNAPAAATSAATPTHLCFPPLSFPHLPSAVDPGLPFAKRTTTQAGYSLSRARCDARD